MSGVVAELLLREGGGSFTVRETDLLVSPAASEMLGNNPERVGYTLINTGSPVLQVGWGLPLATPNAIPIQGEGGGIIVGVREDFILPIFPLFGVVAAGLASVHIVEIIRVAGLPPEDL